MGYFPISKKMLLYRNVLPEMFFRVPFKNESFKYTPTAASYMWAVHGKGLNQRIIFIFIYLEFYFNAACQFHDTACQSPDDITIISLLYKLYNYLKKQKSPKAFSQST